MNLHEDKDVFSQILADTADYMGLHDIAIVEKDYFVTFFLQKIFERHPNLIFKGGTSLSKCYKLINRFSEDIDLAMDSKATRPTEGQRKRLKQDIVDIITESGFTLVNPNQVRSRCYFNNYVIDYRSASSSAYLNPHLIIETTSYIKSFPTEAMSAASLVHDFLLLKNAEIEITKYGLEPFTVMVQSLNRTFIDKTFAIVDYYLGNPMKGHSRHIYDLFKIYPGINIDESFVKLTTEVREVRKRHDYCRSAQDGINMPELLKKIIDEDFYKSDYNQITQTLLFEDMPYTEVITVLNNIVESDMFA